MSERPPRKSPDRAEPVFPLRLLRTKKGEAVIVRTLSRSYSGLLTHYKGRPPTGRGEYCPGAEFCENHAIKPTWKGYCSVEQWDAAAQLWFPSVLEISESLDQDFYGRFGRGQVWEVRHLSQRDKYGGPRTVGAMWEQLDETTLPEEFDMRPVLVHLYKTSPIVLNVENPLPRRVLMSPSRDAGPVRPGRHASPEPGTTEDSRSLYQFMQDRKNGTVR